MNNLVEPGVGDLMRWYRIQTWGRWYAVKACCRSCATRRLHAWTFQDPAAPAAGEVKTEALPDWLVELPDGATLKVNSPAR